jgi:uncharacterized protein YndB with AHSA1/START domain
MAKQIKHEFFFSRPVAVVWDYLTKPELMAEWLMPNDFLPIAGHAFMFTAGPVPKLEFDGMVYCTVLEIVPLKKLVYSWKCGPGNGIIKVDSLVTWRLFSKENGTQLVLDHTGLKEADFDMYNAMNDGWLKNVQKITGLINR